MTSDSGTIVAAALGAAFLQALSKKAGRRERCVHEPLATNN